MKRQVILILSLFVFFAAHAREFEKRSLKIGLNGFYDNQSFTQGDREQDIRNVYFPIPSIGIVKEGEYLFTEVSCIPIYWFRSDYLDTGQYGYVVGNSITRFGSSFGYTAGVKIIRKAGWSIDMGLYNELFYSNSKYEPYNSASYPKSDLAIGLESYGSLNVRKSVANRISVGIRFSNSLLRLYMSAIKEDNPTLSEVDRRRTELRSDFLNETFRLDIGFYFDLE